MKVATGSYTGNGTSQSITGVGFQPLFVAVHTEFRNFVFTSATMGANATKDRSNGAIFTGGITSLDADGFSVGSDATANANGSTLHYLALGGFTNIALGSYTGDDVDDREITGVGFDPDLVLVWRDSDNPVWATTTSLIGYLFESTAADGSDNDSIQDLITDGFEVGTALRVNDLGVTYYWLALKRETGRFIDLGYTGNGVDDRSIAGFGFQPTWAYTVRLTPDAGHSILRWADLVGENCLSAGGTSIGNCIQAFEADGIQVGVSVRVNENTDDYAAFAFADGINDVEPPDPPADLMPDSVLGGPHIVSRFRPVVY